MAGRRGHLRQRPPTKRQREIRFPPPPAQAAEGRAEAGEKPPVTGLHAPAAPETQPRGTSDLLRPNAIPPSGAKPTMEILRRADSRASSPSSPNPSDLSLGPRRAAARALGHPRTPPAAGDSRCPAPKRQGLEPSPSSRAMLESGRPSWCMSIPLAASWCGFTERHPGSGQPGRRALRRRGAVWWGRCASATR